MSNIDKQAVQAVADLKAGYTLGHADVAILNELARLALASLEAEPVAWLLSGGGAKNHVSFDSGNAYADPLREVTPLYTAPPAPVSVPDAIHSQGEKSASDDYYALGWNACRAAMLQGSEPVHDVDNTNRQFESLGCAEDTSRRFKCTGLIVTSDERKMEIPHCSKHPETELQVNPFERLMSYPPQPVMYCPLCRPSVAERVEFDKQLRQWKEVK
ncbi:hypothetical protein [Enterobacter hormaechei]|uniref:hypothetical protein n=1 Tax=Enterobacter hormaechei TaxID=158836 RepID=UPI001C8DCAFB|nr:hypothetical protein [Enterobacter hormaechei]